MSDLFYEEESLHERAVRRLVAAHRDEYDSLVAQFDGERVEELEARIRDAQKEIIFLKGQNPNGTLVPALEQTANALVGENAKLADENAALHNALASAEKDLATIKKAVMKL